MLKTKKTLTLSLLLLFSLYVFLLSKNISPQLPSKKHPIIFYSNQCRQSLRQPLLKAIKKTKKSIHLVMFGLQDKLLLKNLEKTSKKIKNLKIFFDEKNSPKIKNFSKKQLHPIKNKKGLMHQKILVIDNKIVFLGSANMTKQSLSMHNNLIIGFYNKELASFLSKNTPFNSGNLLFSINKKPLDLYLLPDKNNKALNKLKEIIKSSSYSIKVVMFTLTHKELVDELINAKKRGVDLKVFVDFRTSFGASKKAIKILKKEKVNIFLSQGVELLHHKYLYVDEKTLVFGSANWTKAAFHKNRDLFVIFHQISKNQKKFMNKLQKIIELESKQF